MNNSSSISRWLVSIRGTLRWWCFDGLHRQVKGIVSFEALSVSPPTFHIKYQGDEVIDGQRGYYTQGILHLPDVQFEFVHRKLKSENATGRVIVLTFQSTATTRSHDVQRIQLSVPISDTCDDGKLFLQAVEKAVQQRDKWRTLMRHREHI